MLVECLIQREGPTRVSLERFDYEFRPHPELTGGDDVTPVCSVNSRSHREYLLAIPDSYRLYVPRAKALATKNTPKPQGRPRKDASPAEMTEFADLEDEATEQHVDTHNNDPFGPDNTNLF